MQAAKDFDVRKLKPKKAYTFDVAVGDEKKLNYFSSSIIHLVDDNESISILYNELANVEDHVASQILENGSNTIQLYIYDEGKVKISESQTELVNLAYQDDTNR